MKWSLVVLILVGIIGAMCAAVLMASYRSNGRSGSPTTQPTEVSVVVACKAIPAMSMVSADAVEVHNVPAIEAPQDGYRDVSSVIGRVLAFPAGDKQQLTRKMFVDSGSSRQLAALLPAGMRAVTLAFADSAASENQLYPGCRVNVIFSMKPSGQDSKLFSKTLFRGLQVLAVGSRTVLSDEESDGKKSEGSRYDRRVMVTLMVNDTQAQLLALAGQQGNLSLSMRGPTDDTEGADKPTLVKDLWVQLGEAPVAAGANPASRPFAEPARQWQTEVYRGGKTEVRTFDIAEASGGI